MREESRPVVSQRQTKSVRIIIDWYPRITSNIIYGLPNSTNPLIPASAHSGTSTGGSRMSSELRIHAPLRASTRTQAQSMHPERPAHADIAEDGDAVARRAQWISDMNRRGAYALRVRGANTRRHAPDGNHRKVEEPQCAPISLNVGHTESASGASSAEDRPARHPVSPAKYVTVRARWRRDDGTPSTTSSGIGRGSRGRSRVAWA
jgi:hypothetical protein